MEFNNANIRSETKTVKMPYNFSIEVKNYTEVCISNTFGFSKLKLNNNQTESINELLKKISTKYEESLAFNTLMTHKETFFPNQTKVLTDNSDNTKEKNEIFEKIFDIINECVLNQLKSFINPKDVEKITINSKIHSGFFFTSRESDLNLTLSKTSKTPLIQYENFYKYDDDLINGFVALKNIEKNKKH